MKTLKLFTLLAASALFAACGNNANNTETTEATTAAETAHVCCKAGQGIEGRWIQPIPGQEGQVQGIELKKDGIAESINMATLVFDKWNQPDSTTLTLTGKSIGNGQTIDVTETYTVAQGDPNTLNLIKDGSIVWSFTKENAACCGGGACKEGGCGEKKAEAAAEGGCKEGGCKDAGCGKK